MDDHLKSGQHAATEQNRGFRVRGSVLQNTPGRTRPVGRPSPVERIRMAGQLLPAEPHSTVSWFQSSESHKPFVQL